MGTSIGGMGGGKPAPNPTTGRPATLWNPLNPTATSAGAGMPALPPPPGMPGAGAAGAGGVVSMSKAPGTAGASAGAGGAGGGGAAGGGGGGNPQTTNYAQTSPYLQEQIQNYRKRLSSDTTDRAINRSNLATMDAAALGAADLKGSMARRGVLGSGAGSTFLQDRVYAPAQREAAGKAADIALGRERDLDQLVLGGTGIMGAPDQVNLANRSLALQQQGMEEGNAIERERLQMAQQNQYMAQLQALQSLYGMYGGLGGSYGYGGGYGSTNIGGF